MKAMIRDTMFIFFLIFWLSTGLSIGFLATMASLGLLTGLEGTSFSKALSAVGLQLVWCAASAWVIQRALDDERKRRFGGE
jgi:hypothetical protein